MGQPVFDCVDVVANDVVVSVVDSVVGSVVDSIVEKFVSGDVSVGNVETVVVEISVVVSGKVVSPAQKSV